MIVKRNSLHLRLYDKYSNGCMWDLDHNQVNFCKYSRKVMLGVLSVLGIIGASILLLLGPMQIAGTSLLWMFTDNSWLPFIGGLWPSTEAVDITWLEAVGKLSWVLLSLETIVVGCVAFVGLWCLAADKYHESDIVIQFERSEPGFIRTWYRSWKDNFCPIVEVEQKEENK